MGRIKIGSLKYGDVRKALRNRTTAESEEGKQIHMEYLEEAIKRQYHVEVKSLSCGLRPPDSNPRSSNFPYQLCDLGKLLNLSKHVSLFEWQR